MQQLKASQHHWALLPFVVGIVVGLSLSTVILIRPPAMEYVVTNVYIGTAGPGADAEDQKLSDKMQRFEELMKELHPAEATDTGPRVLAEEVTIKLPVHYGVIMAENHPPGPSDSIATLRHTWARDVPREMITYYTPVSYQHREESAGTLPNIVKLSAEELSEIQALHHVCEHKMNTSKWFYIGYDNAYVKVLELETFLYLLLSDPGILILNLVILLKDYLGSSFFSRFVQQNT